MKKTYIAPTMVLVEARLKGMIAGHSININNGQEGTFDGAQSRGNNWSDDDE